jgi:hypothetical protein
MKTNKLLFLLLVLTIACSDDDPKDTNQKKLADTLTAGSWRITSFVDSGTDETNHFTGYTFTFVDQGGVTAMNGTTKYTGAWKIEDANSDDDTLEDLELFLDFPTPPDFTDLSEDWDILELTDTKLKLEHISGGNGGTDLLIFEKN